MLGNKSQYKKIHRIFCVCLALLVGSAGLFFNKSAFRAAEDDDSTTLLDVSTGYSTVLYDNTNGLPTSEANAVAQTPDGFIWIGSYSGLIRYDGRTFERISSADTGITSVVSLFVDRDERLWVGSNDSGVGVFDKGEWTIFNKENGLQSLSVRDIAQDDSGRIYLATTEGVAIVDKNMELSVVESADIREAYVRMMKVGPDDVIYGLTIEGEIFTMRDGRLLSFYTPEKLKVNEIHTLLPDPNKPGKIYCATKGSELYYGDPTSGFDQSSAISIQPLSYVNSIDIVNEEIWVCTDNGIGRINEQGCIPLLNLPMTTSIEDLLIDQQNNVWFASSQQGVMKIVSNRFANMFEQYALGSEVVYSTCLFDGKLFVGTKTNGLVVLENHKVLETVPLEQAVTASGKDLGQSDLITLLGSSKIRSIVRDNEGNLWISSFGTCPLIRFDGKKATVFTSEDGLPSDRVRTILDCDGYLAVACTGGVAILENDKVTSVVGEEAGISNTEILTVAKAKDGSLLIGTDGDGIYIAKNGKTEHISTDSGLMSDVVLRIKKDRTRDLFWIVTSNSIASMNGDGSELTNYKEFPYSNNFDLYQSAEDEMWILSSNGLYMIPTEEMLKNKAPNPRYYGRENGLTCFPTSNSYSELSEDGNLYISCTTGVVMTNLDKDYDVDEEVQMMIPYIDADGERVYPNADGVFDIKHHVKKVTVYAYCFNYSLINPTVSYCLETVDREPIQVSRSNLDPITYTNLSGGKYVFRLQIIGADGEVRQELAVTLVKHEAFWEATWFRVLSIIGLIAAVLIVSIIIGKKNLEKLQKKEHEQRILIREIVEAFAKVIDMKDRYTNGHSTRVAEYTAMLTRELGYDEETVEKYYNIALLHDIGKIGISMETLNKPGRLTDEEFKEIKSHSGKGYVVLKDISIMPELAIGARDHHERPDGHGYPKGLKGEEIPRVAQIIAVADTFDAMYSDRPYRKRMNFDKAISIIREVSGTQLTEDVVEAFLRLVDKGEFRHPDDVGGGSTEDITNIHKAAEQAAAKEAAVEAAEKIKAEEAAKKESQESSEDSAPKETSAETEAPKDPPKEEKGEES
ncbi:MAG: HD domain-containing protein [Clostridiales bacterium]|nr:HD domain-containing protein [Clostridiales bacterium]